MKTWLKTVTVLPRVRHVSPPFPHEDTRVSAAASCSAEAPVDDKPKNPLSINMYDACEVRHLLGLASSGLARPVAALPAGL